MNLKLQILMQFGWWRIISSAWTFSVQIQSKVNYVSWSQFLLSLNKACCTQTSKHYIAILLKDCDPKQHFSKLVSSPVTDCDCLSVKPPKTLTCIWFTIVFLLIKLISVISIVDCTISWNNWINPICISICTVNSRYSLYWNTTIIKMLLHFFTTLLNKNYNNLCNTIDGLINAHFVIEVLCLIIYL